MIGQPTSRDEVPEFRDGKPQNGKPQNGEPQDRDAYIRSVLDPLRQVPVPTGLEDRLEARLNAEKLAASDATTSHWGFASIAAPGPASASIAIAALAIALVWMGLIVHRSNVVQPLATLPPALHHPSSSGVNAASAIRIPARAIATQRLAEGRGGRSADNGRHTGGRRALLPPGVAVPTKPTSDAAAENGRVASAPQGPSEH